MSKSAQGYSDRCCQQNKISQNVNIPLSPPPPLKNIPRAYKANTIPARTKMTNFPSAPRPPSPNTPEVADPKANPALVHRFRGQSSICQRRSCTVDGYLTDFLAAVWNR